MPKPNLQPVTPWHKYLLRTYFDPDRIARFGDSWTIADALHVRPSIDVRALRRAVDRVLRRHDTLRLRFVESNGKWHAEMRDKAPGGLEVEDHGEVDETTLRQIVADRAGAPIDLLSDRLVDIRVLRFGDNGDVVVIRVHHALVDGYGLVLLIEELIKTLLRAPLTPHVMSYTEYLDIWYGQSPAERKEREQFWEGLLGPVDSAPKLGRIARGMAAVDEFRGWANSAEMPIEIGDADIRRLAETARRDGASFATVATAAFCEALCAQSGSDRVYFDLVLGRSSGRLANYVGEHTLCPILRYDVQPGILPALRGRNLTRLIGEATAHAPSEATYRGCPWERRIYDAGGFPRQFGSWVYGPFGKVTSSSAERLFRAVPGEAMDFGGLKLTRMDLPQEASPLNELTLKVNYFGELPRLSFVYDADSYSADDLRRLQDAMPL